MSEPAPSVSAGGTIPQWLMLFVLSAAFIAVLQWLRLPAALLLGSMLAAILLAGLGGTMSVHRLGFMFAQSVIGCMIARIVPPSILGEMLKDWPLFLAGVLSVVLASAALGYILARLRVMPGTTAVWGSTPGAATAMMLMSEAYGADMRLVALMQYSRVLLVAIVASVVARLRAPAIPLHEVASVDWFPHLLFLPFAETLGLVALGMLSTRFFRFPAGPLLLPMALGMLLQGEGLMTITLPPWLLAVSYALLGWTIGLRFTRAILIYAAKAMPKVIVAMLGLIAVCAGFSVILTAFTGIDPLTAYLAMSPGGADSVAIIAVSSNVDVPFVMAMQTGRFLVVLFTGPAISRFVAKRVPYSVMPV